MPPTLTALSAPAHWCHPILKPLHFDYMGFQHPTYSLCSIFMVMDNLVADALFLKVIFRIRSPTPNINLVSSKGAGAEGTRESLLSPTRDT